MKILYISNLVSERKMNDIIKKSKVKPLQSIQKFHRLICEGLAINGMAVKSISSIPVSSKISKKKIWREKKETINNVQYNYLPFINIKIIRQICIFIFTIPYVIGECLHNRKNKVFICDILNTTISTTTLLLAKIFRTKTIAIITDLPRDIGKNKSLFQRINLFFQNKYDGYIFLTEAMNEVINTKHKPYIVIEGISDIKMKEKQNLQNKKYKEKVCIYAGGLYEKYGVKSLIEAFKKIKQENVKLYLYGDGELVPEIKKITDSKIQFFGVVPNEVVVKEEIKATLLINPRFTNEEYTKYSFPSKNLEYMSTGTPVLTTNLPGMPQEYHDYVYLFDEETQQGYQNKIEEILSKSQEELYDMGKKAKKFVLTQKNNILQTKKILQLITEMEKKDGTDIKKFK